MLDRVLFERERGVKAASYPASVEIGGVYTGGIPLNLAKCMSQKVAVGAMGDIARLDDVDTDSELKDVAERLVPALEPMVPVGEEGAVLWPRRRRGVTKRKRSAFLESLGLLDEATVEMEKEEETVGGAVDVVVGEARRRLPAFAPRNEALVSEL